MPICLQEDPDFDFTGLDGIFGGFTSPFYESYVYDYDYYSQEVEVTVLSEADCLAAYNGDSTLVTSNTYCGSSSSNLNAGPCGNDWGVPLFSSRGGDGLTEGQHYELVGITTFKQSCGSNGLTNKPTIVSRVGSALQWIKDTINPDA